MKMAKNSRRLNRNFMRYSVVVVVMMVCCDGGGE
jgi:hypothetical protein